MRIYIKVAAKYSNKAKKYIFFLGHNEEIVNLSDPDLVKISYKQKQMTIAEIKQQIGKYSGENPEDLDIVKFEGFFCSRLSDETMTENKDKQTQLGMSCGEDIFYCINSTEKEKKYITEFSIFDGLSVPIKNISLKDSLQKIIENILNDEFDPKIKLALLNGIEKIGTHKLKKCHLKFEVKFDEATAKRIQEKVNLFKYENIFQFILESYPDLKEVLFNLFDMDDDKAEKAFENIKKIFKSQKQMAVAELREKYGLQKPNRLHQAGARVDDKCLGVTTQENILTLLLQHKQEEDRKEQEAQKFVNLVENVLNNLKNNSRSKFYFRNYYEIIKNKSLSVLDKEALLMKIEISLSSRNNRLLKLSLQSLFSSNNQEFLNQESEIVGRVCEAIRTKNIGILKEIKHARDNYKVKKIPPKLTPRSYAPHDDL